MCICVCTREIGRCVATLSFTYYYDHQATDGSKTGSLNIRAEGKVRNSEGCHSTIAQESGAGRDCKRTRFGIVLAKY